MSALCLDQHKNTHHDTSWSNSAMWLPNRPKNGRVVGGRGRRSGVMNALGLGLQLCDLQPHETYRPSTNGTKQRHERENSLVIFKHVKKPETQRYTTGTKQRHTFHRNFLKPIGKKISKNINFSGQPNKASFLQLAKNTRRLASEPPVTITPLLRRLHSGNLCNGTGFCQRQGVYFYRRLRP